MRLRMIRSQRGAGFIGCLFMVALVAAAVFAGFQYVMPTLRHNSFSDRLNESLGHFPKQDPEGVQKQIIQMAEEFDIVLTPDQVKVDNSTNRLVIDVRYEKVVDLKVWQKTLPFALHRAGPS